jgi:hypothetical protein
MVDGGLHPHPDAHQDDRTHCPERQVQSIGEPAGDQLRHRLGGSPRPAKIAEEDPALPFAADRVDRAHQPVRCAIDEVRLRLGVFEAGARGGTISDLLDSNQRLYDSELTLGRQPKDKLAAAMSAFELAKAVTAVNRRRIDVGQASELEFLLSKYKMIDYQIKAAEAMKGGEAFNPNMIGD